MKLYGLDLREERWLRTEPIRHCTECGRLILRTDGESICRECEREEEAFAEDEWIEENECD